MVTAIDVQIAANELANRAVIRAEAVDAWVTLALEQPDPGRWTSAIVSAALDKLNTLPQSLTVKAEARLQLLDIRRAIHAGIANSQTERPKGHRKAHVRL